MAQDPSAALGPFRDFKSGNWRSFRERWQFSQWHIEPWSASLQVPPLHVQPLGHLGHILSKVISSKVIRKSCHSVCSKTRTQSHQPVTMLHSVTEHSPKGLFSRWMGNS